MKQEKWTRYLLVSVFAVSLVLANIYASRTIYTGLHMGNVEITLPGGILLYAITFLCTDIIGERWGKDAANECVWTGFTCQIFVSLFSWIISVIPAVVSVYDEAYKLVFGQNIYFTVGALISYMASQTWDVFIFHKLRKVLIGEEDYNGQRRWIWNNVSTITSQLLDTILFSFISFGIGLGWLFNSELRIRMLGLCIGQYLCKVLLAFLDTPLFYLFTSKISREN